VRDIDRKIIECIKNRQNEKALSYLYSHTLKKVRSYIIYNSGSTDDANDIFQDAVIIFFKAVIENKFDTKCDVDAFIFTISRNLWINNAKRKQKLVHNDIQNYPELTDYEDHLENLISRETLQAIDLAYSKLEETCRKVLRFVAYEKLSMKEIKEKMGYTSENVAKTTHYRCKQSLFKIIKSDKNLLNALRP